MRNVHQIASHLPLAVSPASLCAQAGAVLALWRHRWTSRRDLGALDRAALTDIGLSRTAARLEAAKPFWRA